MQLDLTPAECRFRDEVVGWLEDALSGRFAALRHLSRPHDPDVPGRPDWERALGAAGWNSLAWPTELGGRAASLVEQMIFAEEYARAGAPGRIGHVGLELVAPTIIAFGTAEQKQRFLPGIAAATTMWAQLFSEPQAGSDLANVQTRARLEAGPGGQHWVINGQKIWSSYAQLSDWGALLCRTEPESRGPKGLSYLLLPMRQPGITVAPIRQLTGDSTFCEVFFDNAVAPAENILGEAGQGFQVALAMLAVERGVSTLAQQMQYINELGQLVAAAKANGAAHDTEIRRRIARAHAGLQVMRHLALRVLNASQRGEVSTAALTLKLYYTSWHQALGDLALDVLGGPGLLAAADGAYDGMTAIYLHSRADTIYAGTSQIQRNIIAERGLGLPKEPRGMR